MASLFWQPFTPELCVCAQQRRGGTANRPLGSGDRAPMARPLLVRPAKPRSSKLILVTVDQERLLHEFFVKNPEIGRLYMEKGLHAACPLTPRAAPRASSPVRVGALARARRPPRRPHA